MLSRHSSSDKLCAISDHYPISFWMDHAKLFQLQCYLTSTCLFNARMDHFYLSPPQTSLVSRLSLQYESLRNQSPITQPLLPLVAPSNWCGARAKKTSLWSETAHVMKRSSILIGVIVPTSFFTCSFVSLTTEDRFILRDFLLRPSPFPKWYPEEIARREEISTLRHYTPWLRRARPISPQSLLFPTFLLSCLVPSLLDRHCISETKLKLTWILEPNSFAFSIFASWLSLAPDSRLAKTGSLKRHW